MYCSSFIRTEVLQVSTWLIKIPPSSNTAAIKIFYKTHEEYILEGLRMPMNKKNQSVCNC